MRCKKHFSDRSSAVGVCASCLRECLYLVIDAQSQPLPLPPSDEEDRRSLPPPPLVFPRSVSPYISRRKSDTAAYSDLPKQRFFSTPQAGPTASSNNPNQMMKKKKSKFSRLTSFFRSGSAKSDIFSDPSLSAPNSNLTASQLYAHPSPSSSWIPARRNSIVRHSSLDETSSNRPSHARVPASPARSQLASGIGFCLSPLVRPSPGRHWKGKATGLETGYSGDIRPPVYLSTAASLRANRSRKLADFGRFDHNR